MSYYMLKLPRQIAHDPFLTTDEKLILAYIQNFERRGLTCFSKDDAINECLGIPLKSISDATLHLKNKGYIDIMHASGQRALVTILRTPETPATPDKDIFEL